MKLQFIGIGGVGISALAKCLLSFGHDVCGINDSESPDTLDELRKKSVRIDIGTSSNLIESDADLYIYSTAWFHRAPEIMDNILK